MAYRPIAYFDDEITVIRSLENLSIDFLIKYCTLIMQPLCATKTGQYTASWVTWEFWRTDTIGLFHWPSLGSLQSYCSMHYKWKTNKIHIQFAYFLFSQNTKQNILWKDKLVSLNINAWKYKKILHWSR